MTDTATTAEELLATFRARRDQAVVQPKGNLALYSTDQAVQYQLCNLSLENSQQVAEHYNISLADQLGTADAVKAVRIDLHGAIDESMRQKLRGQSVENLER